jgi:hypothetical protein
MSSSLSTTIRRIGLVLAATATAAVVTGSALAADRPAASFYTPQQIQTMSQSWAARGGVFTNRPAASYYTPQQIETMSQSWAARGGLLANRPLAPAGPGGFDWGDFGIGAAAMLGLLLLAIGLAAGAHYSRRGRTVRPAS